VLRGGLAGLGGRGGLGALDPVATPPLSFQGFTSKDQGGAFSSNTTRLQIAGCPMQPASALSSQLFGDHIPGGGASQILYAVPQYFERDCTIKRLCSRTYGSAGGGVLGVMKLGIYTDGRSASAFAGSPYPSIKLTESSNFAITANHQILDSQISIFVAAGTRLWFTAVYNVAAVTGQRSILSIDVRYMPPLQGFTFVTPTPVNVGDDTSTMGVGWRHAFSFTGTEALPSTFPDSAASIIASNTPAFTFSTIPAIGYGVALA
jgi:hypothetical protein